MKGSSFSYLLSGLARDIISLQEFLFTFSGLGYEKVI
jgi:hypothetical protein